MIAKISIGSGFRGTLDYLMQNKELDGSKTVQEWDGAHSRDLAGEYKAGERYRIIGGNMEGQTPRELAKEFREFRRLRPNIEKPVHHVSISAGKGDRLTVEQWNEIAARYVQGMGFEDSPYTVIQHRDTDQDHIHLVTSRVNVNGRVVSEQNNYQRAEKLMREIEADYGLERVAPSREVNRAAPTRGEIQTFERTGELSAKMRLQSYVEQALKDAPTTSEFIERLGRSGVEVLPNMQSTGRVSGISFLHSGQLMKGSDLGRGYSWGALQKRGLDYDSKRDNKTLKDTLKRVSEAHQFMRMQSVERTAGQGAKEVAVEVAKMVGRHYLNQLNPLNPYIQTYKLGRDAYRAAKAVNNYLRTPAESPTPADCSAPVESPVPAGEQLPAEAVKLSEKEAVEQLRESAGMPRVQDANDALNQLRDEAKQPNVGQEQKPEPKQETEREPRRESEQKLEAETEREAAEEVEGEAAGEEVTIEQSGAEEAVEILMDLL